MLSTCEDFYDWFTEKTTFDEFIDGSDFIAHTPAHWLVGSQFGCDELQYLVDKGWMDDGLYSACVLWGINLKSMFRSGYVTVDPSEDCAASTNLADTTCVWKCDADYDQVLTLLKNYYSKYLNDDMVSTVFILYKIYI